MQGFGNLGAGKNPTERAEGVDLGQATGVLDPQWVIFFPPRINLVFNFACLRWKIKGIHGYFGRNVALFWFYLN